MNKLLTNMLLLIALLVVAPTVLAATNAAVYLTYSDTTDTSKTITDGDSARVAVFANCILCSSMNVKLELYDSNFNLIATLRDTTTTQDMYNFEQDVLKSHYIQPGNYMIKAKVYTNSLLQSTKTIYLTVEEKDIPPQPTNTAPVIVSEPITTVDEETTYTYQVVAVDADGDNLCYRLLIAPTWLTINQQTGLISGLAPSVDEDTDYTVKVKVCDSQEYDTQQYTLTVIDTTIVEPSSVDIELFYTTTTNNHKEIEDGQSVSFSVFANSILENAMHIDVDLYDSNNNLVVALIDLFSVNDMYSVTYTLTESHYVQPGDYTIKGLVTGQSGSYDSDFLTLTVTEKEPVNTAPAFSDLPDQTLEQDTQLLDALNLEDYATDAETLSEDLFYSIAVDNNNKCGVTLDTDNTIDIVPNTGFYGQCTVTATVSDGELSDTETFKVTVTQVKPCYLDISGLPDLELFVGETLENAFDLDDYVTGSDVSDLTYSLEVDKENGCGVSVDTNNNIDVYPVSGFTGQCEVIVTVSDGKLTDTDTFIVQVHPIKYPPVIEGLPDQYLEMNTFINDAFNLNDYASDLDTPQNELIFSIKVNQSNKCGVTLDSNDNIDIHPQTNFVGACSVNVTVSDGQRKDHDSFTVYVTEPTHVNSAPVLDMLGPFVIYENDTLTFTATATDADGDYLTYSASNLPDGAVFLAGTFAWIPDFDQSGEYTVTISVTDGQDSDSIDVDIKVLNKEIPGPVNHAPEIIEWAPELTLSIVEGTTQTFDITAIDIDGDELSYSWTVDDAQVSTLEDIALAFTTTGTYIVRVVVSDGQLTDSLTWSVTVTQSSEPEPQPPEPKPKKKMPKVYWSQFGVYQEGYISAGDTVQITIDFENSGEKRIKDGKITISIPEFGVFRQVGVDTVSINDHAQAVLELEIPKNIDANWYTIRAVISSEEVSRVRHRMIWIQE